MQSMVKILGVGALAALMGGTTALAATLKVSTVATAVDVDIPPEDYEDLDEAEASTDDGTFTPTLDTASDVTTSNGSAEATASIDYAEGALRTFAQSSPSEPVSASSVSANGRAELTDLVTFNVSDGVVGPVEVEVFWQIDRIVDDFGFLEYPSVGPNASPAAEVTALFSMRADGGAGSFDVSFSEKFGTSGTSTYRETLTFEGPGAFDYFLRFVLNSQAKNRTVQKVDQDGNLVAGEFEFFGGIADAGNSAFLQFVLPEDVTLSGSEDDFLANARDLSAIPLPAPALLLLGGLGLLAALRRRA